jgi:hypothetical protein
MCIVIDTAKLPQSTGTVTVATVVATVVVAIVVAVVSIVDRWQRELSHQRVGHLATVLNDTTLDAEQSNLLHGGAKRRRFATGQTATHRKATHTATVTPTANATANANANANANATTDSNDGGSGSGGGVVSWKDVEVQLEIKVILTVVVVGGSVVIGACDAMWVAAQHVQLRGVGGVANGGEHGHLCVEWPQKQRFTLQPHRLLQHARCVGKDGGSVEPDSNVTRRAPRPNARK